MSVPPDDAGEPLMNRRVLIVEDDDTDRKVLLTMLAGLGQDADAVASGDEALRALSKTRYDLVLMDCVMPGLDGLETARRWRQREDTASRATIVAMSARNAPEALAACRAAGMDDFVPKPMRLDRLAELLRRHAPVLDSARLEELKTIARASDPALIDDLRDGFIRDLAKNLEVIRRAVAAADAPAASRAAHKMAGAASSIGLAALAAAARRLEQSAGAADAARADADLAELGTQADRARAALRGFVL